MKTMRSAGFTLLELLLAGAIMVILLMVLGQLFAGTRQAYDVNERVTDQRQALQAAVELMRYEMALAGYRCVDGAASGRTVDSPAFEVSSSPPRITIRYFEDRYSDGCESVTATIGVEDGDLVRTVDGETVTLVAGVDDISVVSWLNRSNALFVDPQRPPDDSLAGVVLRLGFASGVEEVFTVGFRNRQ